MTREQIQQAIIDLMSEIEDRRLQIHQLVKMREQIDNKRRTIQQKDTN